MQITEVLPIIVIFLFWAIAFVAAFWFTMRALRAPIQYEEEHGAPTHESASQAHS